MAKYSITNVDGIVKNFDTDQEFIEYTKSVFKENEEPDTPLLEPQSIDDCKSYLEAYCDLGLHY